MARAQTGWVEEALQARWPGLRIEIVTIRTSGDRGRREVLGAFVAELQEALRRHEIDLAVHSMKDLPVSRPAGLRIAAVPSREDPRDAILSVAGSFAELPAGARAGTGSLRRAAQLRALRKGVEIVPIAGNVDTRLRKMTEGACDAVVLAVAGLRRLGIGSLASGGPDRFAFGAAEVTATILDPDAMMPAPAQGALALETRAEDRVAAEIASALQCPAAERATAAERAFLEALGGGCRTPIGALGEPVEGEIRLRGIVASPNGSRVLRGEMRGPMQEAERLGADLARQLTEEGAAELLAQIS